MPESLQAPREPCWVVSVSLSICERPQWTSQAEVHRTWSPRVSVALPTTALPFYWVCPGPDLRLGQGRHDSHSVWTPPPPRPPGSGRSPNCHLSSPGVGPRLRTSRSVSEDSIPQTEGLSTRFPGCGFRDAAWDQPANSGQPVSISQPEQVWHLPRRDSRRDDQDDQQPGLVQRLGYVGEQVDEAPGKKREVSPGGRTEPGVRQAPLTALPALEDAPALGHRLRVHTLPVAPLLCAPGPPMRSEWTRSAKPDWAAARSPGSIHPFQTGLGPAQADGQGAFRSTGWCRGLSMGSRDPCRCATPPEQRAPGAGSWHICPGAWGRGGGGPVPPAPDGVSPTCPGRQVLVGTLLPRGPRPPAALQQKAGSWLLGGHPDSPRLQV